MENYSSDLDTALINIPDAVGTTPWTLRDAVEGVQIFGGIGSGKTSGSGRMLALKYLSHGFGGLILTAKPSEKETWEEYCGLAGREDDLVIVEPGQKNYFNFLEYESRSSDGEVSLTENIVQVLKTVIRASEEKSKGKSDDAFWEDALDMLMFNAIDLLLLAYGKITVHSLYTLIQYSPKKDTVFDKAKPTYFTLTFIVARRKINEQVKAWLSTLSEQKKDEMLDGDTFNLEVENAIDDARKLKSIDQFFLESFKSLNEKTRSIIDFSFSGFLFRLLQDPVYTLFCRHDSTFTPEDCFKGKIILVNLPVKTYHKIGQDSQVMFKYIWQRAMEKRNIKVHKRPVFLWADEAQHFLHEHDAEYQATARSSKIATVYISQNLPNYHANMGGEKSEYKVKSFLGTLGTKIFHSNADIDTNTYSSNLIGDVYKEEVQRSRTMAGEYSSTESVSYKLEKIVRPEQFVGLMTGGPSNQFRVEGYMHRQGTSFQSKLNYIKMRFNQNFRPNP